MSVILSESGQGNSTGLLFSVSLLQPFTLCLDADGHWLVPLKLEKRGA